MAAIICVLICLALLYLNSKPTQRAPIAISFGGYTNDQRGASLAVIQFASQDWRFIDYSLGTAEVLMPDGQWKEVGEELLATVQELRPKKIARVLVPLPVGADTTSWRVHVAYLRLYGNTQQWMAKADQWIRKSLVFLKFLKTDQTPIYRIYTPEFPAKKIGETDNH
ncbi:MAG: hypothetical protein HY043_05640 [Verrucomicrobia bacterium]|nr:hypothetical protein [Verrucomicrobiota bacterium]